MSIVIHRLGRPSARRLLYGGLALGAAATLAACGSSSTTNPSPSAGPAGAPGSSGSGSSGSGSSAFSISAKNISGFGTVLVNGKGQTLYMLTSEKGGKITCTDDNGCTKIWPDTELPKGTTAATAGSGIQASLLGTVKNAAGDLYVTYHGWPLYTYAGDSGPAETHGQGQTSFGGTWYVLSAAGMPVTSSHTSSSGGSSSGGSSSGGSSGSGGGMSNGNGGGSYGY